MKVKSKKKKIKTFLCFDLPVLVLNITEILCSYLLFKAELLSDISLIFCFVWMILLKSLIAVFYIIYLQIHEELRVYYYILGCNTLYLALLAYFIAT